LHLANKIKFPIRTKLLMLISVLVCGATIAYLSLAIKLFKEDKTTLVFELNAGTVRTLSAEVHAEISRVRDRIRLFTQGHRDEEWVRTLFASEEDIVTYSLYELPAEGGVWRQTAFLVNEPYLKAYDVSREEARKLRVSPPGSTALALNKQMLVQRFWLTEKVPVVGITTVLRLGPDEKPVIAHVDLKMDRLLKIVAQRGIVTVFLVNANGELIAHPDATVMRGNASMMSNPIVAEATRGSADLLTKNFEFEGERWLGAYADVGVGSVKVISQIREGEAFRASRQLVDKSVMFALIVVTLALFLSTQFSRTLTSPLHELVKLTERVTKWDFGHTIKVASNDEVGVLARSFNIMSYELKKQREQIDSHQAELEEKVKARTADLELQKKAAAEANDALVRTTRLAALGELAGVAAHEVLNPVNNMGIRIDRMKATALQLESEELKVLREIVSGWKQAYEKSGWDGLAEELKKPAAQTPGKILLEEDLQNLDQLALASEKRLAEKSGDFHFLENEVVRITRIINNMRALARVKGDRRRLDVKEPLEITVTAMSDILEKKKVSLQLDVGNGPREDFMVIADRDELVQVFSNLIRNSLHAIQNARSSEGAIRLSVTRRDDRVEVRITDNGTGVQPEDAAKIFEPSFTTKPLEEGTGLGLSISRRLVRAFGGDVELEKSITGKGAMFLVWIPLAAAESKMARAS
jgi:signal transduction histidine kinase